LIASSASGSAQENIDSLWGEWKNEEQSDTLRLNALYRYIWFGFLFSAPDSAYALTFTFEEFARARQQKSEIASAYYYRGVSRALAGKDVEAIALYETGLGLAYEYNVNLGIIDNFYNALGISYENVGEYEKSLDAYKHALKIREAKGHIPRITTTMTSIGLLYDAMSDYDTAIAIHKKSIELSRGVGDEKGIATALNNLATTYVSIGDQPKANECLEEALIIFKK